MQWHIKAILLSMLWRMVTCCLYILPVDKPSRRSGKSTHISMISNSVTHLRSYTNTAIADIAENYALISPVTAYNRRRRRNDIETSKLRSLHIELRYRRNVECFMMFQCLKSVSWCFTSGSWRFTSSLWCFTSGSWCFTMYHNVLYVFHDVLLCLTMFYDV